MTDLPRLLLTGFEPFGGDCVNPSWEVARALDGWRCTAGEDEDAAAARVQSLQLPCVFGEALTRLDGALLDASGRAPVLVVALGLATGRAAVTPERAALNVDDARIADNAGAQPIDRPVVPGGPAAYFSSLPIKAMTRALRAAGLPGAVSNSAGTFVCNHVFYGLMHRLATRPALAGTRGGFVHLPALPAETERVAPPDRVPSMALAQQIEAVRVLLRAALAHPSDAPDPASAEGALH